MYHQGGPEPAQVVATGKHQECNLAVAPDAVNLVSLNFMAGETLLVLDANPNKADLQPPVGAVMKCAPIQSHDPRLSLIPAAPAQGMPHRREDE